MGYHASSSFPYFLLHGPSWILLSRLVDVFQTRTLVFPQVHGRNLLSIDYDRNIRTEKIYDDHRKFTLRIIYDQVGRPFLWLPSSGLAAVNVSYFFNGRLAGLQRGAMSERTDIDKQGRIVSRMFADGKVWSYSYLDKVGDHAAKPISRASAPPSHPRHCSFPASLRYPAISHLNVFTNSTGLPSCSPSMDGEKEPTENCYS